MVTMAIAVANPHQFENKMDRIKPNRTDKPDARYKYFNTSPWFSL